ncbi:transglycosylase SLT domain-containing protein [Acetobacter syzygii]|uniref:Murein transglycosylase n=2 Tax=Acetobacter syzygii TaxID=146476 RepID=A0A270B7P5_9PROT|nr:transglycosylase SLT domain-containing protein [Acetobacter syzygii]PAL21064.1 murein transglycosylase [Acetobacter syzygii]PAL23395.1 murein transglycosylase [Acetobacter syzygii]
MLLCAPTFADRRVWRRILSVIALGGLAVLSACAGPAKTSYRAPGSALNPWGPYILEASERFSIPQSWIRAVMQQESGGHQYMNGHLTRSVHGAVGLMQIKPDTYAELAQRYHLGSDPYNPHDNIMAASGYIRELYDRFGTPDFLVAYSCGPQCMENHRSRGMSLPSYARSYLASVSPHLNDPVPAGSLPGPAQPAIALDQPSPMQVAVASPYGQGNAPPLTDDTLPPPSTGDDTPANPPATFVPAVNNTDLQPPTGQATSTQSVSTTRLAGPGFVWQPGTPAGHAVIQIGAFSTPERAMHAIALARQSSGGLSHAQNRVEKITPSGRPPIWRTRLAGLPSGQTDTICSALRQQGLSCVAVTP